MICKTRTWLTLTVSLALTLVTATLVSAKGTEFYVPFRWELPPGFPQPRVPADNPMEYQKAQLGRYLFYDGRLSATGNISCSSCHQQEMAFTDGRARAKGGTGQLHSRGSMNLVNVAYDSTLTWSDPGQTRLENQALVPMFGIHPVELGVLAGGSKFLEMARHDGIYKFLFEAAFPGDPAPYTVSNIAKAIACFERTIISADSPYDRYHYGGDQQAISESAKRGETLFLSERLGCSHCHSGFNFTDATTFEDAPAESSTAGASVGNALFHNASFHNTGLYNLPGALSYPKPNLGIYEHTRKPADVGKYKTPTLRNVALTAPYMHDGSIATLEDVLDHYAAGGRTIAEGPLSGNGSRNPNKDKLIHGFALSRQERADVVEFLRSLTDQSVLHEAKFAKPGRDNGEDIPMAPGW